MIEQDDTEAAFCLCGHDPCVYPKCVVSYDLDNLEKVPELKKHTGAVRLSMRAKMAIGKKRGSRKLNRIAADMFRSVK